jgi:hypothetical protein
MGARFPVKKLTFSGSFRTSPSGIITPASEIPNVAAMLRYSNSFSATTGIGLPYSGTHVTVGRSHRLSRQIPARRNFGMNVEW